MKLISSSIFIIAIICLLSACKKNENQAVTDTNLIGGWELRKVEGDMIVNYSAGNGTIYQFTNNNYSYYSNGTLVRQGIYSTIADPSVSSTVGISIPTGQYTNRIIFDNDTASAKIFYQISGNNLTFVSGFFPLDGGAFSKYEKQ